MGSGFEVQHPKPEALDQGPSEGPAREGLEEDLLQYADRGPHQVTSDEPVVRAGEGRVKVHRGVPVRLRDRAVESDDLVRLGKILRAVLASVPVANRGAAEHSDAESDRRGAQSLPTRELREAFEEVLTIVQPKHPTGAVRNRLHGFGRRTLAAMAVWKGKR